MEVKVEKYRRDHVVIDIDLDEVTDNDALELKIVKKVEETANADETKKCCPEVSEPIVGRWLDTKEFTS